ncbi:hypothetical protein ILUMI_07083 [Ignelater luminosus]|uniref:Uncharacterized protein n=1 Tax=Ignelater luminosus TaxID=2038154 RepID=A0A8K0D4J1_IGNLU|nr:hypothetical protein ILUMI_07083 [Ignelater luminosus]
MATTRKFSLCTMETVLLLVLFHLFNLSVCIQVISYPFEDRKVPFEKIERPVIKHSDQPSITSVKSLVVQPEYEQITYDTVASSDMLCCVSANTAQNEEVVETYPTVQHSPEELLLIHRNHQLLNILANLFNRVLSNSILKIVHSILNTFDNNRRYNPYSYFSHYNFGHHNPHTPSNKLPSPLLKGLASKPHQQQQQHHSQHHQQHHSQHHQQHHSQHHQQHHTHHQQHHSHHHQLQQKVLHQQQVKSEHQSDKLIPPQMESKNYKCMHL